MSESTLSEFGLIRSCFSDLGVSSPDIELSVGDDAAIVRLPVGRRLCLSVDTQVEGVHFPLNCAPKNIATRALGSALSDLAAMGAVASHFTLALTLPKADKDWLQEFSGALHAMAKEHRVALAGGDTTRGPLALSVQVHGWLPEAKALQRGGALEGDALVVSGTLGDAGGGLKLATASYECSEHHRTGLLQRYYQPEPRLALGELLLEYATACIDISDGLLADAGHLAEASGKVLEIQASSLPISDALRTVFPDTCQEMALSAGDDYELLFTVPAASVESLQRKSGVPLTVIGRVLGNGNSVRVEGVNRQVLSTGYKHFE